MRIARTFPIVALTALVLTGFPARGAGAQIPAAEFAARRDSLARRIGDGVVVAFGARTPVTDFGPPTQLPAFRYLTNYEDPDAAFVLVVRNGVGRPALFTMPVMPRTALYYGRRPDSATVARTMGMPSRPFATLAATLDSLAGAGLAFYALADFEDADFRGVDSLTRGSAFMKAFTARHAGLKVADAHPLVDELRARKSPAEMVLIRRAAEISVQGHLAAMHMTSPGLHEYDVQAAVEYAFRRGGSSRPSYGSIIGSGERGTQLHYMKDRGPLNPGELMVIDAGAEYEGYAADVTRTLPVSGTFTKDQRILYQLVRDAQEAAARNSRPGMSIAAATDSSVAIRARGLAAMGLIESVEATFDPPWPSDCSARPASCRQSMLFTIHGISHGLGLAVHDPAGFYRGGVVKPGDAFTIEPGIYISTATLDLLPDTPKNRAFIAKVRPVVERLNNTGIRIEDDYIATENGLEWISRAPREVGEVEAAMKQRTTAAAAR
ncbi:MAG: M24 family metallopeptidase [Gemmatimonadales bacterium]|nr:M24 family metallopeptidase [Gemmatimonadales bacterium]